jgi:hypothetical protein
MEHIFLTTRDHLTVGHAIRRAELLALGASDALVQAVLATRSVTDTRMLTLAGVKSGKDTGQVPVTEVQLVLLVDPSGAVTTTVTDV